jgi:Xaa-Pro aminopeptidase
VSSLRRVPEPSYPRFPANEYAARCRKAREAMKVSGIDLLLMTERENVVYFTGLATPEWVQKGTVVAAVMIAADSEEPVMALPDFFFGMAEKSTWVNEFVLHRNSHSNQVDFANLLASTIRERGWSGSSIGYEAGTEMLFGMPMDQWDHLRKELPGVEWVDGRDVIWGARMIKSAAEIECLRRSAVANNHATEQLRDYARPGMNELALAAYLRRAMIQDDASEQDRMWVVMRAGKDRYSMAGCNPGDNRIKSGDLLVIDQGIMLDGYASDTARVMSVGKPSALHASVYQKVVEARTRALEELRAGVPASAIYQAVRSVYDKAGFPVHIDMVGHGIGLDPHEPPMLSANNPTLLEENMVVCIEPWVTLPDDQGVLTCEDTFLVKQGGWEQLSLANADDLWVIKT